MSVCERTRGLAWVHSIRSMWPKPWGTLSPFVFSWGKVSWNSCWLQTHYLAQVTLGSWSFCSNLPNARTAGVCHHTWRFKWCGDWYGICALQASTLSIRLLPCSQCNALRTVSFYYANCLGLLHRAVSTTLRLYLRIRNSFPSNSRGSEAVLWNTGFREGPNQCTLDSRSESRTHRSYNCLYGLYTGLGSPTSCHGMGGAHEVSILLWGSICSYWSMGDGETLSSAV